ncbi:MAG: HNH endonuclease [Candidatus Omnitrophica bacterium]|nr:HNH endonuclease [Candidatus Omnitrophota bacterium]
MLSSVKKYAEKVNLRYFPSTEYDKWKEKKGHSSTVIGRFGSWKKVLLLLGIEGGREHYTPDQLIENLESVWKQLGFPPGKRQIGKYGQKISGSPYKQIWGSVHSACQFLAKYHEGKITREELLKGNVSANIRHSIPLKTRWAVLKRDNYKCKKCGGSPSLDHKVRLDVDHKNPVAKGGQNDIENLQTLCWECNQGKKDRV